MYTRQDYLDHKCTHAEYYAQYVNAWILRLVQKQFSLDSLKEAGDNFNGIPLEEWDLLAGWLDRAEVNAALKAHNDFWSLASCVCILKEAARQLIEKDKGE